jgi:CDGSH-type Zn-finger protein
MSETDDEVTITPRDNGPYFVTGAAKLVDVEGKPIAYEGRLALCRCGHSSTKPICDGSHRENGFESVIRARPD